MSEDRKANWASYFVSLPLAALGWRIFRAGNVLYAYNPALGLRVMGFAGRVLELRLRVFLIGSKLIDKPR